MHTKKQRLFLDIMALLGLANIVAFSLTQSSFIRDNIYWVYGFFTVCDIVAFFFGFFEIDEWNRNHYKKRMPARYKTYVWLTGLWILSIPIVIVDYYFSMIDWMQVAMLAWYTSFIVSGMYDVSYLMFIVFDSEDKAVDKGVELFKDQISGLNYRIGKEQVR